LPPRAEAVAQADALAVEGAKRGGPEGAKLSLEAASLRVRVYRVEGRSADALEAEELYRAATRVAWPGACDAEIELALLDGELKADPANENRALRDVRQRHRGESCVRRIEPILSTLSAFDPAPENAGITNAAAVGANDAASKGAVVTPELSAQERAGEPARITSIEQYGGKDTSRVVVFMTEPALFEVGEVAASGEQGPRLFVDIKNAKYHGQRELDGSGLVAHVRVGERRDSTRVVLDLASTAYRRVFYLPEPFRLVIDVSKDPPLSLSHESGPRHVRRVVLDPGHGGRDPGAMGASGLREKDVVLDIAHRAAPLLARELGIVTLLTRDSDAYVPLDERVARANAFAADLFVSIHCNASESAGSRGVMTFVLDASRDDLAARVAARENSASEQASAELATVMSHVVDQASVALSHHFADLLQRSALSSLSPHYAEIVDQGVKSAGFYVLAGARMPAVLFETSFISNAGEERRLDTGDYRQKMADAIVNAVHAFRDGL
jgi:N-acetylmuramoyl-L-alanine amidase